MNNTKTTVLIDGDVLVYQAASIALEPLEVQTKIWMDTGNQYKAEEMIKNKIQDIKSFTKASKVIIALSDAVNNFRKEINPSYKSNRKDRKPLLYHSIRKFLHDTYAVTEKPYLEADDVLGIIATHPTLIEGKKIIFSIDKDFCTIPCTFFKERRDEIQEFNLTEQDADFYWMFQTLTGDCVDGFTGCKGIGTVGAIKILGDKKDFVFSEAWPKVVETYIKKGLTEEIAIMNARMARILRYTDYDFTKQEVILWNP